MADACDVTREEKAPFDSLHIGDGATLLLPSTSRGPLYHVLRLVFRVKDVLEGCPTTGLRSGMRCVSLGVLLCSIPYPKVESCGSCLNFGGGCEYGEHDSGAPLAEHLFLFLSI